MRQDLAPGTVDLTAMLDHWVASGVVTADQAARLRADLGPIGRPPLAALPAPVRGTRREPSLAIEALGYLGSALIVVASVLLASEYWSGLTTAGHLLLVGTAGIGLLLGGIAVPERLGCRRRTAARSALAGLLRRDGRFSRRARRRGAGLTLPADGGIVLALVTVAALVAVAVLSRDLLVLALGGWGALQILPVAIHEWFPGQIAAAIALLAAGAVMVAAAIWVARHRAHPGGDRPDRDHAVIPSRAATLAAVAVAVVATTVVVVLGLT
ncbi:MAG: hypothetical protein ACRDP9_25710 [Kribbellaceae bacterium]